MTGYRYGVTRDEVDRARHARAVLTQVERETEERLARLAARLTEARTETDREIRRRETALRTRYYVHPAQTRAAAELMLPELAAVYQDKPEVQAERRAALAEDRAAMLERRAAA